MDFAPMPHSMKALISKPEELTPQTTWQETKWAWTSEEELVDHTTKGRLCAAALLPFRDREPDWEGFVASIRWMQAAADHYGNRNMALQAALEAVRNGYSPFILTQNPEVQELKQEKEFLTISHSIKSKC